MSLPFSLPGLGVSWTPQLQVGQLPSLPGLGSQPGTLGGLGLPTQSTLSPELLQLVNGSQHHHPQAQQALDLLGTHSQGSRGASLPPAEVSRGTQSQSNQYASR